MNSLPRVHSNSILIYLKGVLSHFVGNRGGLENRKWAMKFMDLNARIENFLLVVLRVTVNL